jgi:hypothetical protein
MRSTPASLTAADSAGMGAARGNGNDRDKRGQEPGQALQRMHRRLLRTLYALC